MVHGNKSIKQANKNRQGRHAGTKCDDRSGCFVAKFEAYV